MVGETWREVLSLLHERTSPLWIGTISELIKRGVLSHLVERIQLKDEEEQESNKRKS